MSLPRLVVGLAAALLLHPGVAHAIPRDWTGNAGTGSWHDADNWSPVGVPEAGDEVTIDPGGGPAITVTFSTGTTALATLACTENLTIAGGTLEIAGASQVGGLFTITGGTLTGGDSLTLDGDFAWTGGTMAGSGSTIVSSGTTGTMSGSGTKILSRTLTNDGSMTWSGGQFRFDDGTLENAGLFEATASATAAFGTGGTNLIANTGTFRKIGPSTLTIQTSSTALPVTNDGTVEVAEGVLALRSGPTTHTGPFTVAAAATLLLDDTQTFSGTATISGGGSLVTDGGETRTFGAPVTLGGDITLEGVNDFTATSVSGAGVFRVANGTTSIANVITPADVTLNGTLVNDADQSWSSLTVANGILTGVGDVTITGILDWSGGTISGSGAMTIPNTATVTMGGSGTKTLSRALTNDGAMTWSGGQFRFDDGTLENAGIFEATASATAAFGTGGTNLIANTGTFRKTGSSTLTIQTSSTALPFFNDGIVDAAEGVLALRSGPTTHTGPFIVDTDATLLLDDTQTFSGTATISGGGSLVTDGSETRTFGAPITLGGDITLEGVNDFTATSVSRAGAFRVVNGTTSIANVFTPTDVTLNGTLVNDAAQTWASLTIANGILTGSGDVTVHDTLDWSAGTISGSGVMMIPAAAIVTMDGNGTKTLSRALVNGGSMTWSGGQFRFNDGTLENAGMFEATASATAAFGTGGTNLIANTGTFRKVGPSTLTIQTSSTALPLFNDGTVDVAGGILALRSGPATHTGPFTVATDATLLLDDTHTFSGTATISGGGSLVTDGGETRTFGAPITLGGDITLEGVNDFTATSVSRAGEFRVSNGTTFIANVITPTDVTLNGTLVNDAEQTWSSLTISNGTLDGRGDVTVTDTLDWASGTLSGSGVVRILSTATGTMGGNGTKTLSRTLTNDGSMTWTGGQFRFNDGTLENAGTFEAAGTSAFGTGGVNAIANTGTFRKVGPSTLTIQTSTTELPFANDGTVEIQEGTLSLRSGPTTHSGLFQLAADTLLSLEDDHDFTANATITGDGSLATDNDGTRSFGGTIALTGDLTLNGGNDFVAGSTSTAGTVSIEGGTTDTSVDQAWPVLTLANGTLTGSGNVSVSDTLNWTAGTMDGEGSLTLAGTGSATLAGNGTKNLNRTWQNEGSATWTAGQFRFSGGTLQNVGTFEASATSAFGLSGTNLIDNTGTFRKVGPSTLTIQTSSSPLAFANGGTVEVAAGTLGLASTVTNLSATTLAGGAWAVRPAATLTLPSGADVETLADAALVTLDGNGAFPALDGLQTIGVGAMLQLEGGRTFLATPETDPFTNAGTLSLDVGTALGVDGAFVQTADGVTSARYDGGSVVPLTATGDVGLDGGLTVLFADGFTPTLGVPLGVVDSDGGTISGTFASLIHPFSPQCVLGLDYAPTLVQFGLETEAPIAVCQDITVQLDASGAATITAADVDGGSSDNCSIASLAIDRTSFGCGDVGTNIVILTVTDVAGNVATCPAVVTVVATGQFIGPRGGSWFDPANWCSAVPGLTQDVFLDATVVVDQPGAVARSVTVQAGGDLRVGGPTAGSIEVAETVTVQDQGTLTIDELGSVTAPSMVIEAGGTLRLLDASSVLAVADLTLLDGALIDWGGGTIQVSGTFTATQAITVGCTGTGDTATLRLVAGTAASPAVVLCEGGVLEGVGTVMGDLQGGGLIRPGASPGELTIGGALVLEAGGELALELAGLSPATEHDVVTVVGDATLGGRLTVELIDEFDPAIGDRVTVLTAASTGGDFDEVVLPAPSGDRVIDREITATGVDVFARNIGDLNADGAIDLDDLLLVLGGWGPCAGACPADADGDGTVGIGDLLLVLSNWGG